MFFNAFAVDRLFTLQAVSVVVLLAFPVFGSLIRRQSPCAPDEYFDGIDKKCVECSLICQAHLPPDFCRNNCPDYFSTSTTSLDQTSQLQSVRVVTSMAQSSTDVIVTTTSSTKSSLDIFIVVVVSVSAVLILAVVIIVIAVFVIISRMKSALSANTTLAPTVKDHDIIEQSTQLIGSKTLERSDSSNSGGSTETDTTTVTSNDNEYQKLR